MGVSPKTVREVEFREKLRGYHPEDVDQFLERVAKGIEILQERLRAATERAVRAERAAAESAGSDDTMRRTLVLAQRTADAAVQEAQEQAAQLTAEGEAKARQLVADAEAAVARMVAEAEDAIQADVAKLNAARETLQADVAAMTRWIDEHRAFLTSTLSSAVERLQNDLQVLQEPPTPSPVEVPVPSTAGAAGAAGSGGTGGTVPKASEAPGAAEAAQGPTDAAQSGSTNGALGNSAPATGAFGYEGNGMPGSAAGNGDGEELWTEQGRRSGKEEAVAAAQFFAELRDAVDDPQPLGPREGEPIDRPDPAPRDFGFFDDDDLAASRRFGSRLRRRR
jgi:cell division initiation protein